MLTESDRKHLRIVLRYQGRERLLRIALWFAPAVFVLSAIAQAYTAFRIGDIGGIGAKDLLCLWVSGREITEPYRGVEHVAVSRLAAAFAYLALAIAFSSLAVVVSMARKREKRIATAMQNAGLLEQ